MCLDKSNQIFTSENNFLKETSMKREKNKIKIKWTGSTVRRRKMKEKERFWEIQPPIIYAAKFGVKNWLVLWT